MRNSPLSSNRAFTLIELAVVLLLAGLLAGALLSTKQAADTNDCYVQTKARLEVVRGAIERYAQSNDRFPMPARRNVGVEEPSYGREINGSIPAEVAELDSIGGAIFGALPFTTLSIPVENATDCWGNKFTYAVTIDLTDTAKFRTAGTLGAITIESAPSTVFLAGAGYAVISHGADQLGAVQANYNHPTDKKWCVSDGTFKTENCELSNTIIAGAEFNDGKNAGARYFDDLVVYRGKPWRIGSTIPVNAVCGAADSVCALGTFDPATRVVAACPGNTTWTCRGIDGGSDAPCSIPSPCGPPPPPCNCSAGGHYVTWCSVNPDSGWGAAPCYGAPGDSGTYKVYSATMFDTGSCPGQFQIEGTEFNWGCW